MPQLSQDNQECLQKHFFRPSIWTQFLPLFRAQRYNADIHQITENEGDPRAVPDIKPFPPAQLPDSPAAPKLLGLLYSPLSSLTRFFSHLLRRPPPEAPRRRPNFSPLLPALPAARLSRGHEELPGRLSLLLGAALALPGRPSGGRPLRPARPVGKPREEDATAGQSSPMPPMGSERMEMRKRQMPLAQDAPGAAPGQPGAGSRGSNACCFCWCCCCSCSCLTVRNQEDQRPTIASHELRADLPTWEESPAPTLEEVNAWAQSFDKLMVTPAGRNAFREFLRTEFSEENMLFWMACEELKKEANKNIIEEKARIIYEDYISILSPKEVSLDSRVREVINRNMVEPSQHIFDDAQLQIYTLMHRDSYPRFMNSAVYKDLLQSLSEKSIEA
ncbi:PREDICTED: regulator of G-protein signaling 20 isoform X1 [Mandrillus leucophaeus]|uniref:Regulator of G-protein signaling 20 n=1 Tax=Mandrillus leucophaeus TaxID=9568 RepID=A0A2K5ZMA7_MANLE|nr:PREDICTED: regulator of G-protein signaling 20 isoform X1 [Mandrillus leucophaeus]